MLFLDRSEGFFGIKLVFVKWFLCENEVYMDILLIDIDSELFLFDFFIGF